VGQKVVALWLTLLPDDGSRGRFGDGGVSVAMSVGERRARQRASVCSMLNQKWFFLKNKQNTPTQYPT